MEQPSYLSQSIWLELPKDTREKLAALFEMPPRGSVQVTSGPLAGGGFGDRITSDGYGPDHLRLITLDKMNELLGTDTDNFYAAFKELVKNVDDILNGEFKTIYNQPVTPKLEIVIEEVTLEQAREVEREIITNAPTEHAKAKTTKGSKAHKGTNSATA